MQKENDPFGFANAIELDHLNDEQLNLLQNILSKIK